MNYEETISLEIIEQILNIHFEEKNSDSEQSITEIVESDPTLYRQKRKELDAYLSSVNLDEVKKVYAFYYYGRSFLDGSISPSFSFFDMLNDVKNESLEGIVRKLHGTRKKTLEHCWDTAKDKFSKHETEVEKNKEALKKRLASYEKEAPNYFNGQLERRNSTSQIFKNTCKELPVQGTKEIAEARDIVKNLINETGGSLVVDFLGGSHFDNLDNVECDDEIIKLYWKYSNGPYYSYPHNLRVDMAFEELQEFEYGKNTSVILKGYYRNKKEIKQYYNNKEKLKKINSFGKSPQSYFQYRVDFDKKQRGSIENFSSNFLPWRFFNVIILPRENLPSSANTTKLLIIKNITDMHNRGIITYNEYAVANLLSEDEITMYGNRFRKIVEGLLKFILLVSNIMFKDDYEKDMLGKLLEQLKLQKLEIRLYDQSKLPQIVNLVEKSMINNLNLCSHDNVKHKIDSSIIRTIFSDFERLIDLCYEYFELQKV